MGKTKVKKNSPHRDRKSTLFLKMLEMARADGRIVEMESLLNYIHPERGDDTCLTDYKFDIVPKLTFGSNEGVYLAIYLEGSFDSTSSRSTRIGTIKTLDTDMDACRLMGALGGILMYHGRRYVNQEIHRYTPQQELIRELEER